MINWTFNSNEYTARDFGLIPEGDYKVTINNVVEKVFNSGNDDYDTQLAHRQFQLFYHLAIFCGLRKGGLITLEWNDLDFTENSVSITKSTSMIDGEMITKKPKTNSSIRKISVPASVMQLAQQYRKEQLRHKLSLAQTGKDKTTYSFNGTVSKCTLTHHTKNSRK